MIRQFFFVIFAVLLCESPAALAEEFKKGSLVKGAVLLGKARIKNMENNINAYLEGLPSEDEWDSVLADFGPIKGNYCSTEKQDDAYRTPCHSQLDCICKEHAFGYSLRKYSQANRQLLEKVFGVPFTEKQKSAAYDTFLRKMALVWFAGKISGENLSEAILAAHALYKNNPKEAQANLEKLVVVNEILNDKIESIKEEKNKFVESRGKVLEEKAKIMAAAIQPLALFSGIFALGYEWKFTDRASLHSRLSFLASSLITETYLGFRNKKDFSIFAGIGSKLYVLGEALKYGVYLEPMIDFGYESVRNSTPAAPVDIHALAVVPAVMLGLDKVFNSGIQLGVSVGIGGHFAVLVSPDNALTSSERHFLVPKFYGTIGYAW